jgi:hypothetical protein
MYCEENQNLVPAHDKQKLLGREHLTFKLSTPRSKHYLMEMQ